MNLYTRTFLVALCGASLAIGAGCSDDETETSGGGMGGSDGGMGGSDGGMGGSDGGMGGMGGASATANVRVAHLSPFAGDVDVCFFDSTGMTELARLVDDGTGLAYKDVTDYTAINAQEYTVRLVAGDAADCSTGLVDDFSGISFTAGTDVTVTASGIVATLALNAFVDDNTAPAAGMAKVRLIHLSEDAPNVDVGTGTDTTDANFTAIWPNVAYGTAGKTADNADYHVEAAGDVVLRASPVNTEDQAIAVTASLAADTVVTAFAIGEATATTPTLEIYACADDPAAGGTCAVLPVVMP